MRQAVVALHRQGATQALTCLISTISCADCKDKFLIQCIKLSGSLPEQNEVKEITSDMFDASQGRDVRQTKLRVVLVPPPRPPSPVPEGNEDLASPTAAAGAAGSREGWLGSCSNAGSSMGFICHAAHMRGVRSPVSRTGV